MEEICSVINKFGKVKNTIRHVARQTQGETDFGLVEICKDMLNNIDATKVSNLELFPENVGNSNLKLISFKYNGFNCVIFENIEWEYDELILEISP